MPEQVPLEVQPLIAEGYRDLPDSPGPFLWVYPFQEYSTLHNIQKTFSEECFANDLLQGGTPINTVISTDIFRTLAQKDPRWFRKTIPIVPATVLETPENLACLRNLVEDGVDLIVYGSVNHLAQEARKFLGLTEGTPLVGDLTAFTPCGDICVEGDYATSINLLPQMDDGGLSELATDAQVLATAGLDDEQRVLASIVQRGLGRVGFVRSLSPWLEKDPVAQNPTLHQRREMRSRGSERYPSHRLMRLVLRQFGWDITYRTVTNDAWLPCMTLSRHDNALFLSAFVPDTSTTLYLDTPWGSPIPLEQDVSFENSHGHYALPRAPHLECRVFVKQSHGRVYYRTTVHANLNIIMPFDLAGLEDAEVRFFPPLKCNQIKLRHLNDRTDPNYHSARWKGDFLEPVWEDTPQGPSIVLHHITGTLNIAPIVEND
ncbi:MAG: hypothetical protein IJJ26_04905 [Victivallales bacterium]|nr:hypothetical protein [Victivallales bacterium]